MPKKVLIMTVPFGGGHYATAAKISDLLKERDASLDIEILDVITDGWPAFSQSSSNAYQNSTASNDAFWFKVYYKLTDRFPAPIRWFASIAFGGYAKRKLREIQPDLIIATFPYLGHVAMQARKSLGLNMPIVTVVTDAGRVQGIWLTGREDAILAATPDTVAYADERRMAQGRVRHIGFPITRDFYHLPEPKVARRALGLSPDRSTVLVTSGGLGMSAQKVEILVKRLATLTEPFQLLCVAGKNEQLERTFRAIDFPSHITVHIYGYTDQMPQLMAASDIVCSKSGWLTISEALAAQKPLFLFDAIPGHEEQNALYVAKNKFGIYEPDPVVMSGRIAEALGNTSTLIPLHHALAQHNDPSSAEKLTEYFIGLLHKRPV